MKGVRFFFFLIEVEIPKNIPIFVFLYRRHTVVHCECENKTSILKLFPNMWAYEKVHTVS